MVTIEKTRVNAWNAGGFVVAIIVTAFGWGVTYNTMTNANAQATKQIDKLSDDVKDVRGQLPTIATLQGRLDRSAEIVADNKASIKATNDRVDRIVEGFSNKLDALLDKTNKIGTNVEVLSTFVNTGKSRGN